MRIRADRTLHSLLSKFIELGCSDEVASRIRDAQDHMGHQSPFRGNRDLVELVRFAAEKAESEGDESSARRLGDAVAYARNEVLGPDVEARYELYERSLDRSVQSAGNLLRHSLTFVVEHLQEVYGEDDDSITLPAVLDHLGRLRDSTARLQPVPGQPGYFNLRRGMWEHGEWAAQAIRERITILPDVEGPGGAELPPDFVELARDERVAALLDGIAVHRKRDSLARLKATVLNPNAVERDLQLALEKNTWVFGGRYVGLASRRLLGAQTEIDIPLLRPDGVLHVIEVKRATARLVTHQRGRLIPSAEVHRAFGQVANYLVTLDEGRDRVRDELGIDVRRAQATVVIGHPHHERQDARAVHEALRAYNSALGGRVEIISYQELIEAAEQLLGDGSQASAG